METVPVFRTASQKTTKWPQCVALTDHLFKCTQETHSGFSVSVGSASEQSSDLAWCADGHLQLQHSEDEGKRPAWVTLQDLVSNTKQTKQNKNQPAKQKQQHNQFQSDEIIISVSNTCRAFFVIIP